MTVFGSTCTRLLIDRTLICNAILYHFQITLICGRINRPSSHSHFFSSRAHLSNSSLFVLATFQQKYVSSPPTRPQRFILPRKLQSRYRRHLFTLNFSFKSPARDDLLINFLVSLFTLVQEFKIVRIQSRKNVFETNIVVIHDQIPHISLPHPSFLRSRPHSSRHDKKQRQKFFSFFFFFPLSLVFFSHAHVRL